MKAFYESGTEFKNVQVFTYSLNTILTELDKEAPTHKIVFLLTSSSNYGFGRAQRASLELLAGVHNRRGQDHKDHAQVIDVFTVGHCMYGCASCGLSEHSVPIFFNRYHNRELPYTAADVTREYWTLPSGEVAAHRVLVCPTVGPESFLANTDVLERLQTVAKELEPHGVVFVVKLHGFCCLDDDDGRRPHMLFSLTEAERAGARYLRTLFGTRVVDEAHYNILPFLEAATVVLTDVGSSVPFEALHFPGRAIVAHINGATKPQDPAYLALLNVFSSPADMETLLLAATSDVASTHITRVGDAAEAFFRSKYGPVDGIERERIATARNWASRPPITLPTTTPTTPTEIPTTKEEEELSVYKKAFAERFTEPGPLEYLAQGLAIPAEVTEYVLFEASHAAQLEAKGVPRSLWHKLFAKITSETFDAGAHFQYARDEEGTLLLIAAGPEALEPAQDIFLVDHAWSTTLAKAHQQLTELPALTQRMEGILGIEPPTPANNDVTDDVNSSSSSSSPAAAAARVDAVYDAMWTVNNYYCVDTPSGMVDTLYVMDEVGSRIAHSPEPNVRCVPFIHGQTGAAYSLFWPIQRIESGDVIARDFAEGIEDPFERAIKLYGRGPAVSSIEPFDADSLQEMLADHDKDVAAIAPPPPLTPAGKVTTAAEAFFAKGATVKVFSDAHLVRDYLKRPEFTIVTDPADADVRWIADDDIRDYDVIPPNVFVSQFPNDRFVCFKNELIATAQQVFGSPSWLPESFDLTKDLDLLVARFIEREKQGKDNHWIAKPWNSGRSSGIVVTKQLPCLIRLSDCGPYLASKCK